MGQIAVVGLCGKCMVGFYQKQPILSRESNTTFPERSSFFGSFKEFSVVITTFQNILEGWEIAQWAKVLLVQWWGSEFRAPVPM